VGVDAWFGTRYYTVAHGTATASIASRSKATVHAWQCHSAFDETERAYALA